MAVESGIGPSGLGKKQLANAIQRISLTLTYSGPEHFCCLIYHSISCRGVFHLRPYPHLTVAFAAQSCSIGVYFSRSNHVWDIHFSTFPLSHGMHLIYLFSYPVHQNPLISPYLPPYTSPDLGTYRDIPSVFSTLIVNLPDGPGIGITAITTGMARGYTMYNGLILCHILRPGEIYVNHLSTDVVKIEIVQVFKETT
jgi:hypothetical protein